MSKAATGNAGEQGDQVTASDLALWSFLDQLKTQLRTIREDKKALRFCLRRICEYFQIGEGCFAVLHPGASAAELVSAVPRTREWDMGLLTAFLRKQNPAVPRNIIVAPVNRRGRVWAVVALKRQDDFGRNSARALLRIARMISESIEAVDWQRIVEVRTRIDR